MTQLKRISQRKLEQALQAAQSLFPRKGPRQPWSVELELASGPAMKRLNAAYRGKDHATDVLSFPAPEVFRKQGLLGELVICLPVLKRQAREQRHSPERELEVLLAHGVLHLLGMDHEKGGRQEAAMLKAERKLLASAFGRGMSDRARGARKSGPAAGLIQRSRSGIEKA